MVNVNLNKDEASKQASSTKNNMWRPEVHQLATIEAQITLAEAYLNRSQAIEEHYQKKEITLSNAWDQQENAINHAGKALEAVVNYRLNPPSSDAMSRIYGATIKKLIGPTLEGLDKYQNKEEMTALLEEFVTTYDDEEEDSSEGSLIMQVVGIYNDGYSGQTHTTEFLKKKGLEQVLNYVSKIDGPELMSKLRTASVNIQSEEGHTQTIANNLTEFITRMSGQAEYNSEKWDQYRNLLTESKTELAIMTEERNVMGKDLAKATSWVLDVVAGLGENVSDLEYQGFKSMAYVALQYM